MHVCGLCKIMRKICSFHVPDIPVTLEIAISEGFSSNPCYVMIIPFYLRVETHFFTASHVVTNNVLFLTI